MPTDDDERMKRDRELEQARKARQYAFERYSAELRQFAEFTRHRNELQNRANRWLLGRGYPDTDTE